MTPQDFRQRRLVFLAEIIYRYSTNQKYPQKS